MSMVASVILYDCDCCQKIVALKEDDDWENFENEWHAGLMNQFCPVCKSKPENQPKIKADEMREKYLAGLAENRNVAFAN